jgi:hypothetical protein
MTHRRLLTIGTGAILAFGIAALGVILVLPGAPPPKGSPASQGLPPQGAEPPAAASSPPVAAAKPDAPVEITPARQRPSAEARTPWAEVPMAARAYELGPDLARPILDALDAARDRMTPCFEEEARALERGEGPGFDPADPPTGPAVLLLLLESREGGLDVVDAEIAYLGTSTRALAECCRHVVRGWPVVAPLSTPGRRYRLKYLLN